MMEHLIFQSENMSVPEGLMDSSLHPTTKHIHCDQFQNLEVIVIHIKNIQSNLLNIWNNLIDYVTDFKYLHNSTN